MHVAGCCSDHTPKTTSEGSHPSCQHTWPAPCTQHQLPAPPPKKTRTHPCRAAQWCLNTLTGWRRLQVCVLTADIDSARSKLVIGGRVTEPIEATIRPKGANPAAAGHVYVVFPTHKSESLAAAGQLGRHTWCLHPGLPRPLSDCPLRRLPPPPHHRAPCPARLRPLSPTSSAPAPASASAFAPPITPLTDASALPARPPARSRLPHRR
jgi:hypothetical protein